MTDTHFGCIRKVCESTTVALDAHRRVVCSLTTCALAPLIYVFTRTPIVPLAPCSSMYTRNSDVYANIPTVRRGPGRPRSKRDRADGVCHQCSKVYDQVDEATPHPECAHLCPNCTSCSAVWQSWALCDGTLFVRAIVGMVQTGAALVSRRGRGVLYLPAEVCCNT